MVPDHVEAQNINRSLRDVEATAASLRHEDVIYASRQHNC